MFEYMAAGLPQIASDFPMWKEIIETSECGFTADPLNPEEIAEKVTQLLSKPKLHQKLSESGRRAHEEIYNWQVEEKKLLALYGKLLKER
jgi:glycosyltransferase involved in cell wall biosynthesis